MPLTTNIQDTAIESNIQDTAIESRLSTLSQNNKTVTQGKNTISQVTEAAVVLGGLINYKTSKAMSSLLHVQAEPPSYGLPAWP